MALALDWQWAGGYIDPKWYYCDALNGLLRLYSAPQKEDGFMPNMILQKIPSVAFTATARVRFKPCPDKKLAGTEQAGMIVFGRKTFTLQPPVSDEWMYLRLSMNEHQQGQFYTSSDGQHWAKSGDVFQAEKGYWTGAQIGLFCTRRKTINDAGWLDVDWFEIQKGWK
jgi:beta-xylosidase